jgi:hypothetical protein
MPKKVQLKLEELSEDESDSGVDFKAPEEPKTADIEVVGIRCGRCKKKTKDKNVEERSVKGKSEGKERILLKAECEDCGANKTSFKSSKA